MTDYEKTDDQYNALSGSTDTASGLIFPTIGEDPWYTSLFRSLFKLARASALGNSLRVYKSGTNTFAVAAGEFRVGPVPMTYAGSTGNALSSGDNYIYLNADGTLSVSTVGFPASTANHVALAVITSTAGTFAATDIVDHRGRNLFRADGASGVVEASTAGSGAPNVLLAAETGKYLTNEGATARNYHTLSSAVAGLAFEFVVQDSDGMRIVAAAGDTIRVAATASAAAGYIQNATVGSAIRLLAVNSTEWIAVSYVGTWTVDS